MSGPAGLAGPPAVFLGAWSSTKAYLTGNAISYEGSSYVALKPGTDILPTSTVATTGGYWSLLAQQGSTGEPGPAGVKGATGPVGPAGPERPTGPAGTSVPSNLTKLSSDLSTTGGVADLGATVFSYDSSNCQLGDIVLSVNGYGAGALPADGRLLAINQNVAMFSVIGTNFGGNGVTNFALPELRAFAPQGMQYSICVLGIFPSRI